MVKLAVIEGITEEHLSQVYSDPYITKVGHDLRPASPIHHPLVTYLSAWVDGIFVGAFMIVMQTSVDVEVHALLHRKALPHSRQLGRECLSWIFSIAGILRITAMVIEGLESAMNYSLKIGFKYEGFKRDVCTQNGEIKGVHILGMTRRDWSTK